jgi:1-acyl-sn-glycerol-3-phosphate acyltransferase
VVDWTNIQEALRVETPKLSEDFARRCPAYYSRYAGEQDKWGYNIDVFARWEILFRFLFEDYFNLTIRGLENIPNEGRAILVGNHSGLLPVDAAVLAVCAANYHPSPRRIRYLVTDWFFTVPGLKNWIINTGQVRATLANAHELLSNDEIVGIYPEGLRGVGKTFRERYRIHDFHPGFVQMAIETQTPLVPVATIGGDEIFPNLVNVKTIARLIGMPFFPILGNFPWMPFPLYFMCLPVKWMINVGKPIHLPYPPDKAKDKKLCLKIAREIQFDIQRELNDQLRERKSAFTGWEGGEEPDPSILRFIRQKK